MTKRWCSLALHSIFEGAGEMTFAKIQRWMIVLASHLSRLADQCQEIDFMCSRHFRLPRCPQGVLRNEGVGQEQYGNKILDVQSRRSIWRFKARYVKHFCARAVSDRLASARMRRGYIRVVDDRCNGTLRLRFGSSTIRPPGRGSSGNAICTYKI